MDNLMNELGVIEQISHASVLRVYEQLYDDNNYYIVSEILMHGNMFQYMDTRQNQKMSQLSEASV